MYTPKPIDISGVSLPGEVVELGELLAKNAHDVWAIQKMGEGWTWGPEHDASQKKHPDLIPYEELSEPKKDYDRKMSVSTLKAIIALGYRIEKA